MTTGCTFTESAIHQLGEEIEKMPKCERLATLNLKGFFYMLLDFTHAQTDESLIWSAASFGHAKVVEVLIEAKANFNECNKKVIDFAHAVVQSFW